MDKQECVRKLYPYPEYWDAIRISLADTQEKNFPLVSVLHSNTQRACGAFRLQLASGSAQQHNIEG